MREMPEMYQRRLRFFGKGGRPATVNSGSESFLANGNRARINGRWQFGQASCGGWISLISIENDGVGGVADAASAVVKRTCVDRKESTCPNAAAQTEL